MIDDVQLSKAASGQPADTDRRANDSVGAIRALRVLEALAGLEQPAGLQTIATATQLTKTKAYRVLRALQDEGFIDHLGHAGYRVGSRSVALASLMGPRPALIRAARPIIGRLAAITNQSGSLHLRSGSHRVLVLGAESKNQPLRGVVIVGERAPLTSGCSGTSILAFLPEEEAATIIASRPRRETRPSRAELDGIRADGYALSFSDNHVGINGIAAPLLDPADGYPLGSLAIAGMSVNLPEASLRRLSGPLIAACTELAPQVAKLLGPNSSERVAALDVTIQDMLDE